MQKNLSGNNLNQIKDNLPLSVVKILDNTKRKRKRTVFRKYPTVGDYMDDYYSSEDEDCQDCQEESSEAMTDGVDLRLDLTDLASKINGLQDVINLCNLPLSKFRPCNRGDLVRLKRLKSPIEDLNRLIGMSELKRKIIYHGLFYCQDLHQIKPLVGEDEGAMLHSVIVGPPGSGKTTVAKIIAKIYLKLGILKSDKFVIAKRKDLIGEFLGQTAPKTTKVLESALGGVLFIDEAYSLGNEEKRDIYSKECLDTLNQFLTEHKKDIVVIVAGYEDDLKKSFFSMNQGLERRFPWIYKIDDYNDTELRDILLKQIRESGWSLLDSKDSVALLSLIKTNRELFNFSGGDIESYLNKCKMAHSQNTFGLPAEKKGKLTLKDMEKGLEMHRKTKENHESEKEKPPPDGMYM
jgi:hypothetical protein